jgi:hypothetical protein
MQDVEVDHKCPGRIPGCCQTDCLVNLDDLEGYRFSPKCLASRRHQTVDAADFLIRRSGKDKENISGNAGRAGKCDLGHEPLRCCDLDKMLCQLPLPLCRTNPDLESIAEGRFLSLRDDIGKAAGVLAVSFDLQVADDILNG